MTFTLIAGLLLAPVSTAGIPLLGPANDDRAAAAAVAVPSSSSGSTLLATQELLEPSPCGGVSNTVWFRFEAAEAGTVVLDTFGSSFDTVLAVYERGSNSALACNDDTHGLQSLISLPVVANATYDVQLGGFAGTRGSYELNLVQGDGNHTVGVDLVVLGVSATSPVTENSTVDVSVDFGNAGDQTGPNGFILEFFLDGVSFERQEWPPGIPAGWFGVATSSVQVGGVGNHTIDVVIDAAEQTAETDETNNAGSTTVTVVEGTTTSGVDLVVFDVHVKSSTVSEGEPVEVLAEFGNIGSEYGTTPFVIEFRLDGAVFARQTWPEGIPPGWSGFTSETVLPEGLGLHFVEVVIDADDHQVEDNETNNAANATIEVVPAPDVSVDVVDLRRVPLQTEAGDVRHPLSRWEAKTLVCNDGDSPAASVRTTFSVASGDGEGLALGVAYVKSMFVDILAPGACVEHRLVFDTPGVVGDFRLFADAWSSTADSNRDNNRDSMTGYNLVGGEGGVVLPLGAIARS